MLFIGTERGIDSTFFIDIPLKGFVGLQAPKKWFYSEVFLELNPGSKGDISHPALFGIKVCVIKQFQIASLMFGTGIAFPMIRIKGVGGYEVKKMKTLDTPQDAPWEPLNYQIFVAPFINIGYIGYLNKAKTWGLKLDFYLTSSLPRYAPEGVLIENGVIHRKIDTSQKNRYLDLKVTFGFIYNKEIKHA